MRNKQLRLYLSIIGLCIASSAAVAQSPAPDAAELTKLLNDFLAGASRGDVQVHDRFWADDLIYTRSAGRRVTKAEVMRDVRSATAPKPGDPRTTYTAEDVRIQQYGTTAIVAFRLVATTETDGTKQVANLLNSGTFLKRDGKWRVVNWQSTRMPESADAAKQKVIQAHDALFRALVNANVKTIENLTTESFAMTHRNGNQDSRAQLVQRLSSGQLKYSKLDTSNVIVDVTGDTAVVRGSAVVETTVAGSSAPSSSFKVAYTLVFINQGGAWRALALHGSSAQ